MSSFQDREDTFEKKYAHDEEMKFRLEARCCKLFGIWAAEKMGLSSGDAETYAKEVVAANLEEVGFDDVKRKVMPDFAEKGIEVSDREIDKQLEKYLAEAKRQLMES